MNYLVCDLIVILVGISTRDKDHLKFLFEMSDYFCVFPTFGVIPMFRSRVTGLRSAGLDIDPTKVS